MGVTIPRSRVANPGTVAVDWFSKFKPEDEKEILIPKVVENETLQKMKIAIDLFSESYCPTNLDKYNNAAKLLRQIEYSARDVTNFSLALAQLKLNEYVVGFFMSALVNESKEEKLTVITEHLDPPPHVFGAWNLKHILVRGNLGEDVGAYMRGGSITVLGDVSDLLGEKMTGGTVTVNGNAGIYVGHFLEGGTIILNGNARGTVGEYMEGGTIHINGEYPQISHDIKKGDIFHKGKQIVKNGRRVYG